MKKAIYILLTTFLGLIISFIAHALIEAWYIREIISKGTDYPSGETIFGIGYCALPIYLQWSLLIGGLFGGFLLGFHWWRIVYIEERRWKVTAKSILGSIAKTVFIVGCGTFIFFIYQGYFNSSTVCDRTLRYSIGNFDERFGITRGKMISSLVQAEEMWEKPAGIELFQYDPNAEFKVNLVFDERQQQAIENKNLEMELENLQGVQDDILEEYKAKKNNYQKKVTAYELFLSSYEKRLAEYNSEVNNWNKKGGAPEDVYDDLQEEQEKLEEISHRLKQERLSINTLGNEINDLVQEENNIIENFNSQLSTYKDKFGEARQFDQGDYDGMKINIYQFNGLDDLRLILAHEMGHALEIGHLENSKSNMYYLMDEQNLNADTVTQDDIQALQGVCGLGEK